MTTTDPTPDAATGSTDPAPDPTREGHDDALAAVVKTRTVPLDPDAAFALFTDRMGDWWPTASHSVAGDGVTEIRFQGRLGGRVVEVTDDGDEHSWADVTAWDPPHRFVLSWHPSPAPVAASDLEVTFTAADDATVVRLVHTGWERFGDRAEDLRENYRDGWDHVLAPYVATATSTAN